MALDENFKNLKTKYLRKSIIVSCIGGLCAALFFTGAIWLILKLCGVKVHWAIYIAMALVIGAACGALLFFLTRPRDIKLSKTLDDEYGLKQKVQTLLEFDGVEGDMYELQRQDARKALAAIKPKKPTLKQILIYVLVPFVALAMFISAIAVPSRYKEDIPFVPTNWQLTALNQLIDEVSGSELEQNKKDEILIYVSSLLELVDLEEGEQKPTTGQVNSLAKNAMNAVMNVAISANSYTDLADALAGDEPLNSISKAFKLCQKSYGAPSGLKNYETDIRQKRATISGEIVRISGESVSEYKNKIGECATLAAYRSVTTSVADGIDRALATFVNSDGTEKWEGDALKTAVAQISVSIKELIADTEGWSLTSLKNRANGFGDAFVETATGLLDEQVYTEMMCEYTRRKVASIFGITIVDPDDGDGSGGDDDDGNHGGGAGDEVVNRGGNDVIYYPYEDKYVVYGDKLDDYWKKAEELMERQNLPEELKKKVNDYFEILARGLQSSSNSNTN